MKKGGEIMNTVYIIFKNGEVTTIKSKLALTIATGFISQWFDMSNFTCIPEHNNKNKTFYLVEKGLRVETIIEI